MINNVLDTSLRGNGGLSKGFPLPTENSSVVSHEMPLEATQSRRESLCVPYKSGRIDSAQAIGGLTHESI